MLRAALAVAALLAAPALAWGQTQPGPYNPGVMPSQVSGDASMTAAGAVTNSKFNGGTNFGSAAGKTAGASSGAVPVNGAALSNNQPLWTNGSGQPITINLAAPVVFNGLAAYSSISSTTLVMAGYGSTVTFTPAGPNGRVFVNFVGSCRNTTANDNMTVKLYYGTGTAVAQGLAPTGTAVTGALLATSPTANATIPCSLSGPINGLTAGTTYNFDVAVDINAGGGTLTPATFSVVELP